jgi:hypothetical protein
LTPNVKEVAKDWVKSRRSFNMNNAGAIVRVKPVKTCVIGKTDILRQEHPLAAINDVEMGVNVVTSHFRLTVDSIDWFSLRQGGAITAGRDWRRVLLVHQYAESEYGEYAYQCNQAQDRHQ